jgi:riboflavin synthase
MFTGIIEEMGVVRSIRKSSEGLGVSISAKKALKGLKRGGSIAVNGVCLTATTIAQTGFHADLSFATVRVTNLGELTRGERVNLERAIRLNDRLEGHMVSGHVEGVGVIRTRKEDQGSFILTLSAPASILKYCIPKGSIAVDGISLTIQSVERSGLTLVIIPHTAKMTTLGHKGVGASVNLETDLIGKYIERLLPT